MQKIVLSAQNKLMADFASPIVTQRVSNIQYKITTSSTLERTIHQDNYKQTTKIPAYYDPNIHTIFLNHTLLSNLNQRTLFVICYHELVHGASLHTSYELPGINVFQSGVKFERYHDADYCCFNRMLNEGMVQFFTIYHNQFEASDYAYAKEVLIVEELVNQLGLTVIKNALLYEQYTQLKTRFEARYGLESFAAFTSYIDEKRYAKAYQFLKRKQPAPSNISRIAT